MSIHIRQILDGGIDLETMKELPRSLHLVCGKSHAVLPITEEQLKVVLSLLTDSLPPAQYPLEQKLVARETFSVTGETTTASGDSAYQDSETGVSAL